MPDTARSFIWYDLLTPDPEAAAAFYADVVGWRAQVWDGSGQPYTVLHAGERPVAGLMALPDHLKQAGAPPRWQGYIAVEDVDAAAADVQRAGGTVHRAPADIPGVGRFAVLADPQGAVFLLLAPTPPGDRAAPQPMPPGTPGHVGWHELVTTDWRAALDFYAGRFGWTAAEAVDLGPMGTYQLFAAGGAPVGGMMDRPPGLPAGAPGPGWTFYVTVDGIDAAVARITEGGGRVLMGPHEVPGGAFIVQATDPQGGLFALTSGSR